jgi:cell division protein FtsB
MTRIRGNKGKFIQKSNEARQVRSLRVTDSAWSELGNIAEDFSVTRADLIEKLINDHVLRDHESLMQENEKLKKENEKLNQEIHVLQGQSVEVKTSGDLGKEVYQLGLNFGQPITKKDLENISNRVLQSFTGKRGFATTAPQYKWAKKACEKFIEILSEKI